MKFSINNSDSEHSLEESPSHLQVSEIGHDKACLFARPQEADERLLNI